MEDVKQFKRSRSDALRKFKTLTNKLQRICDGSMTTTVPLGNMLVELDDLWMIFVEEHGLLTDALQMLEEQEAGAAVKEGKVTGKTMQEYYDEAQDCYKKISEKVSAIEEEKRAKNAKAKKFVCTRNVNAAVRSVKAELDRIGTPVFDNPEVLRKHDPIQIEDVKVRLSSLKTRVSELDHGIEELVSLEEDDCKEALDQSQLVADDARLKADAL